MIYIYIYDIVYTCINYLHIYNILYVYYIILYIYVYIMYIYIIDIYIIDTVYTVYMYIPCKIL